MASEYLFNRDWKIAFKSDNQPAREYVNLRVEFHIEKNSVSSSNKSKISVYNLNSDSIKAYQKGSKIQFYAGYKGNLKPIFLGIVTRATTKRSGPDVVSEFELGEGESQLINSIYNKSYPGATENSAGTTAFQIISDLANALSYNNDQISIGTAIGIESYVFKKGFVAKDSVRSSLDKVTKLLDLQWSIQNDVLQILPKNAHLGDKAVVVSSTTGLIGIPSQNGSITKFSSLLNSAIFPGVLVELDSKFISGTFKVNTVVYDGDTHGNKWNLECECSAAELNVTYPTGEGTFLKSGIKNQV